MPLQLRLIPSEIASGLLPLHFRRIVGGYSAPAEKVLHLRLSQF